MKQYDVIIIGAGPGGIYSAWELAMKKTELKIAVCCIHKTLLKK